MDEHKKDTREKSFVRKGLNGYCWSHDLSHDQKTFARDQRKYAVRTARACLWVSFVRAGLKEEDFPSERCIYSTMSTTSGKGNTLTIQASEFQRLQVRGMP